jgi:hypothetical protein
VDEKYFSIFHFANHDYFATKSWNFGTSGFESNLDLHSCMMKQHSKFSTFADCVDGDSWKRRLSFFESSYLNVEYIIEYWEKISSLSVRLQIMDQFATKYCKR